MCICMAAVQIMMVGSAQKRDHVHKSHVGAPPLTFCAQVVEGESYF